MIVFDGSNSMWGQIDGVAKIEIARGVMQNLLGDWSKSRNVGLMAYGHRERGNCADIETLITPAPAPTPEPEPEPEPVLPEVTITGPESAVKGSAFEVRWSPTITPNDYVTILPVGTKEGETGNYKVVRDNISEILTAPAETGLYELRYMLREGRKTLATAAIEVTEPTVDLSAPDQIRIGDELTVGWSATINPDDYIGLAPMGSEDNIFDTYDVVRGDSETRLKVPATEGMYEVRYVLRSGGKVIARRMIEVLPQTAALNTGASLSAPATGAPGAVIEVGFDVSSDSADQRLTLAKADQAIFTWLSAVRIEGAGPVQIILPDEPGSYELRYLDVSNQAVLARQVITVE